MPRFVTTVLDKMIDSAFGRMMIRPQTIYRFKAYRHGIEYVGLFEKHGLALFQDPVSGSSFAVKEGEPVESGIRRVRTKFGLSD